MATKRRPPPTKQPSPPQPPAESSEDEEEEVESEEERSGKQSQAKGLDDDDDSDVGDDSGEEESESESEQPTPNQPRSAAAASDDDDDDEGDESGEPDSKTEEEEPVPNPPAPSTVTTGKTSNGDSAPEFGKNADTPLETATGVAAKKSFRRIWNDVDQITLLKGMVDYIETEGKDPITNIEGFWLFIRKKLSFTVTEWQLTAKMRSVKTKYRSNLGKNRAFSKAYDAEVFELSKKVWGAGEKSVAIESGGGKKRKGGES